MTEFKLGDTVNFDGMIGEVERVIDDKYVEVTFPHLKLTFSLDGRIYGYESTELCLVLVSRKKAKVQKKCVRWIYRPDLTGYSEMPIQKGSFEAYREVTMTWEEEE